MAEALKPCPFCGKNLKIIEYLGLNGNKSYYIKHICGIGKSTTAGTAMLKTEEEVIAAWNSRVTEEKK